MKISRRTFLSGIAATASAHALADIPAQPYHRHDPSLAVFISDLHINGLRDEVPTHLYEEQCFRQAVAKILALRPLPAHVVCFGDIAYHWGQPEDYALAAKLFQPLLDAGIKLTLGLGNHDRRDNFLVQWPSYAKSTLVPGRIVSKVEMPHVDLLMLDTSSAKSVEKKSKSHPGDCSKEERDWLAETLKAATKPVITCSHHRPNGPAARFVRLQGTRLRPLAPLVPRFHPHGLEPAEGIPDLLPAVHRTLGRHRVRDVPHVPRPCDADASPVRLLLHGRTWRRANLPR